MNWQELIDATNEEIIAFAAQQDWARAMADCQQDRDWHAEGDVWTHTKMVCDQLQQSANWPSMSRQRQVLLLFTAILHDAGKPLTTVVDPDTGRVSSPKHAMKGEHLARRFLRELDCDLVSRETIAKLVRYHGRPVFLAQRENPIAEVVRHSWLSDNQLLYEFATADTRGRITESMDRPVEELEYWKLLSIENGCWLEPWSFTNDQQRFQFFFRANTDLEYVPFENYRCQVTMMAGLPGSGKDTWAQQHASELPTVSLDDVRRELKISPTENQGSVTQLAKERCREWFRVGQDFVFNATNTTSLMRQRWLRLFNDYRARIKIVYLEPSLSTILAQNRKRPTAIPESVIRRLANRLEPPTWAECHELVWVD